MENDNNQNSPVQGSQAQPQQIVVVHKARSSAVGICALIFGIISIFFFSALFVPLSLIMAIIALIQKQTGLAIGAIICAMIGTFTSPTLLLFFTGILAAITGG